MESITKFLDPHIVPTVTGDDLDVDKVLAAKGVGEEDSDTVEINITNNVQDKAKVSSVKLPAEKESTLSDLISDKEKLEDSESSEEISGEETGSEETSAEEEKTEKSSETEKAADMEDTSDEKEADSKDSNVKAEEIKGSEQEEKPVEQSSTEGEAEKESVEEPEKGTDAESDNDTADITSVDQEGTDSKVDHGESDLDVDTQQPAPLLKLENEYDFHTTKVYELPNGAKIVYINKQSDLCYCAFDFKVGSFYEDDSNRGISHLLEHLMFNGCPGMSSMEFNEKMDKLGMSVNAFTDYMLTSYHFSGLKPNFIPAFDLYCNLIKSFTPTQEIVDKERGVVINEIGVRNDNNWVVLHEAVLAQAYRQHPIVHPVIGYEDVIRNISVDQVKSWYEVNYNANNLTVYLVGDFPEEDLVFVADKLQAVDSGNVNIDPVITDAMVVPFYKNVITRKDGAVQTLIESSIVFKNEAFNYYELNVMANVLGGTMSSYLWEQFREERSIAYQVNSYISNLDPQHVSIHLYAGLNDAEDADLAKSIFKDAFQYAKAVAEDEFMKGLNIQMADQLKSEETECGLLEIVRDAIYYKFDLDEYVTTYKNLTYDSYQSFVEDVNSDAMLTGILYPMTVD